MEIQVARQRKANDPAGELYNREGVEQVQAESEGIEEAARGQNLSPGLVSATSPWLCGSV